MAAEASGNILRSPSIKQKPEVIPDEILASTAAFTQKGGTIALSATNYGLGATVPLAAGTVLGRTASEKLVPYTDAGTHGAGSETAIGVLRQAVDVSTADAQCNVVLAGILKNSKLVGMTAAAIADLNGRQDTNRDIFVF